MKAVRFLIGLVATSVFLLMAVGVVLTMLLLPEEEKVNKQCFDDFDDLDYFDEM